MLRRLCAALTVTWVVVSADGATCMMVESFMKQYPTRFIFSPYTKDLNADLWPNP